jgi:hypothetical protein
MTTIDDARRALGVGPDADRAEIRAAYRRRIRALHPDLSGDETPANHAVVAELVEAYQRLQGEEPTCGVVPPRPRPGDATVAPPRRNEAGPSARIVQRAMAVMIVVTGSVLLLFFLIAFSQSGR